MGGGLRVGVPVLGDCPDVSVVVVDAKVDEPSKVEGDDP